MRPNRAQLLQRYRIFYRFRVPLFDFEKMLQNRYIQQPQLAKNNRQMQCERAGTRLLSDQQFDLNSAKLVRCAGRSPLGRYIKSVPFNVGNRQITRA